MNSRDPAVEDPFTGLGWGQARRERDWLLRTAIIMSAGALAAQIVTLAPSRIKELVDLALNFKGASGDHLSTCTSLQQIRLCVRMFVWKQALPPLSVCPDWLDVGRVIVFFNVRFIQNRRVDL